MSFLQYHSPNEEKELWQDRPTTVKPDSGSIQRLSTRPASASKQFPASKSGALQRLKRPALPSTTTLARLKPKHIALEKERLYEETLALKMEANYFREENVKLRTKMQQLERELDRRDETLEGLKSTAKERHFSATIHSTHLVSNLKTTIKELRNELRAKEEETQKAKKDIRTSRITELEIELRAYADECMRLKHHLEEVMEVLVRQEEGESRGERDVREDLKGRTEDLEKAKGEIAQLEIALKGANLREMELGEQVKALQTQYGKLCESQRKASLAQESGLIADLAQARQQILASNEHTQVLEAQIQQLVSALEVTKASLSRALQRPSSDDEADRAMIAAIEKSTAVSLVEYVERCAQKLSTASVERKRAVRSVLMAESVAAKELWIALNAAGVETSLAEVRTAVEQPAVLRDLNEGLHSLPQTQTASRNPSVNDTFRVKEDVEHRIAPYFPEYKTPAEVSLDQSSAPVLSPATATALKALGYRFQLHRIPKSNLASTLFGSDAKDTITRGQLANMLSESPLSLTNTEEINLIVTYALDSAQEGATKDVSTRLLAAFEDWEVFTPADEADFDHHITEVLSSVKAQFKAACSLRDPADSGNITMADLKAICEELEFHFNSREYHYLELLFFSLNFALDQVPFSKLIQAYADNSPSESYISRDAGTEESLEEGEKRQIISGYLDLIANELARKSLNLRQVFHSKEGILYPDKLVAGMRTLGIPDMQEREMVVFLEALQCEDLDEYGIEMSAFEGILNPEAEHSV